VKHLQRALTTHLETWTVEHLSRADHPARESTHTPCQWVKEPTAFRRHPRCVGGFRTHWYL